MKRFIALLVFFLLFSPKVWAQCSSDVPSHSSTAYEASHVIKNGSGILCNLTANFHTAALRTILLIDASTVPSDGAILSCDSVPVGTACVRWCFEGLAQSSDPTENTQPISWGAAGLKFNAGIIVAASTSTSGCTTLTSDGNNDWFNWQAR